MEQPSCVHVERKERLDTTGKIVNDRVKCLWAVCLQMTRRFGIWEVLGPPHRQELTLSAVWGAE